LQLPIYRFTDLGAPNTFLEIQTHRRFILFPFTLRALSQEIRLPGGLGNAIPLHTGQRELNRLLQINASL